MRKKTLSNPKQEDAIRQRLMNTKEIEFFEWQNGQVYAPHTPKSVSNTATM